MREKTTTYRENWLIIMNRRNIKYLIRHLRFAGSEEGDTPHFDMSTWARVVVDDNHHICGTAGCLAGHSVLIQSPVDFYHHVIHSYGSEVYNTKPEDFIPHYVLAESAFYKDTNRDIFGDPAYLWDVETRAARWLGLERRQASDMFHLPDAVSNRQATPAVAIEMLDLFLNTGRVDWEEALLHVSAGDTGTPEDKSEGETNT